MSPRQTALAMIGAKAQDRVLVIGSADAALSAELARVTGLNGELRVVDRAQGAAEAVEAAAARAGVLVEFVDAPPSMLPLDTGAYDIVVIQRRLATLGAGQRDACAAEARRVARGGGRIIAIEAVPRPGIFGVLTGRKQTLSAEDVKALIASGGCRAVRVLGDADGVIYIEGINPRA
jgi:ubiquinone/menaquinone biosynthesis C-methylase UbiE